MDSSDQGWIKLHRKIKDHWLYPQKRPFTQYEAWLDLLLEVNHQTEKVQIGNSLIDCQAGESLKSLNTWATRWRWSKAAVRRFIELLKIDSMLSTKCEQKTTHLSIVNWESYQKTRNDSETILKRSRNDSETILAPNKNVKNVKNVKNINTSVQKSDNGLFLAFWNAYPRHEKRKDAEKLFSALKPDLPLLELILHAISNQKQSDAWLRGFIPHPTTWLRGKRWQDEIKSSQATANTGHIHATTASFTRSRPVDKVTGKLDPGDWGYVPDQKEKEAYEKLRRSLKSST